jgi:hypothetical protein
MAMDNKNNGWQLQWTTIATIMALLSDPHPRALQQWCAEEKNFFFLFRFFKKLLSSLFKQIF